MIFSSFDMRRPLIVLALAMGAAACGTTSAPGQGGDYPTFAGIPTPSASEPSAAEWTIKREALQGEGAALNARVSALPKPAEPAETQSFADDTLARLRAIPPAPESARADAEAFARAQRARATPPPRRR